MNEYFESLLSEDHLSGNYRKSRRRNQNISDKEEADKLSMYSIYKVHKQILISLNWC